MASPKPKIVLTTDKKPRSGLSLSSIRAKKEHIAQQKDNEPRRRKSA
ncbi:hypothetical protein N7U66_04200 [Lacinutrix neustonica]|uniref:Uncharacterized protein n=1 Tax=Lacinutrix neustonica TaxID=2980107 RepID=A0A9E8MWK5_9FLAO|nr:hypothetical protein N7U66_04200 [Lacinutrix neustonica]